MKKNRIVFLIICLLLVLLLPIETRITSAKNSTENINITKEKKDIRRAKKSSTKKSSAKKSSSKKTSSKKSTSKKSSSKKTSSKKSTSKKSSSKKSSTKKIKINTNQNNNLADSGDSSQENTGVYIVDSAKILTKDQYKKINELLNQVSNKYKANFVIYTEVDHDMDDDVDDAVKKANSIYKESCKNSDGIILYINMAYRLYAISARGNYKKIICYDAFDKVDGDVVEELKNNNYDGAFRVFVESSTEIIDLYNEGTPYKKPFSFFYIYIGIAAGIVLGLLVIMGFKAQLRSVRSAPNANNYVKDGSFVLTESKDIFLYSHVTKTQRQSSSSHGGGGGGHSSGGGHF